MTVRPRVLDRSEDMPHRLAESTMQEIVIFGAGDIAELADVYFTDDSALRVAAFAVDRSHLTFSELRKRPVVPFEDVTRSYPPSQYAMFVALSYTKLNALRAEKLAAARAMGYEIASYVSSRASMPSSFELKENCFILEDNTIQPFVQIGENVTLWSGNHVGHHSIIENDVFVASHAVISGGVSIGRGSFIGVNATIRDHVKVGRQCVIGAGALVLEDQPDFSVVAPRGTERSAVPSTRLRRI